MYSRKGKLIVRKHQEALTDTARLNFDQLQPVQFANNSFQADGERHTAVDDPKEASPIND
ncbi:unnamed protein product [Eruca vesicaria subsp. sativa]|uniref:Uncharacterized protein n=1 Tax=Eruca vesicaria subsp. sativa TaxID=29727 RepID=A0ABC8L2B1_ERUVS|nr:unnamed protein product [Eruca vesicaria subsp. sativa]